VLYSGVSEEADSRIVLIGLALGSLRNANLARIHGAVQTVQYFKIAIVCVAPITSYELR